MEQDNNKEVPVINFDEVKPSQWCSNHLDADIFEDGTSSLPGIGKPKNKAEEEKIRQQYPEEVLARIRDVAKKWIAYREPQSEDDL